MKEIKGFTGKYAFLSNFYPCTIEYEGLVYQSTEAAYQSAKTLHVIQREKFTGYSPSMAKKMGKLLPLRPDWDNVKQSIMYNICMIKFSKEPLKTKLLETGDAYLEETNWWNDTYWGVCNDRGLNTLGRILMKIRYNLKHNHI